MKQIARTRCLIWVAAAVLATGGVGCDATVVVKALRSESDRTDPVGAAEPAPAAVPADAQAAADPSRSPRLEPAAAGNPGAGETFDDAGDPVVVDVPPPQVPYEIGDTLPPSFFGESEAGDKAEPEAVAASNQPVSKTSAVDDAAGSAAQAEPARPAEPNPPPARTPARPALSAARVALARSGVALPQSLPGGTVMAFSIEYQFQGEFNRESTYVWVIEGRGGVQFRQPVRLQRPLPLQIATPQLTPNHAPYSTYIEEHPPGGRPRRLSESRPLMHSF